MEKGNEMGGHFQWETLGGIRVPTRSGIVLSPLVFVMYDHRSVLACWQSRCSQPLARFTASAHISGKGKSWGTCLSVLSEAVGRESSAWVAEMGSVRADPWLASGCGAVFMRLWQDPRARAVTVADRELPCADASPRSRGFKQVPGNLLMNLAQWECYLKTNGR